jgi:hypothetical protein
VRRVAAERLPQGLLEVLQCDIDWTVRWEVAGRASGRVLDRLLTDPEPEVRERAAARQRELAAAAPVLETLEPSHG